VYFENNSKSKILGGMPGDCGIFDLKIELDQL
jgi:hypothetical protein